MSDIISIIIVGKNEGWRLSRSLESVYSLIKQYTQWDFEVIFVDSKSTDDSINRAKAFKEIRILEITGEVNSAIARNIGARESLGEVLFFIDGDMEIQPGFLQYALTKNGKLRYDYVTGHIDDIFYTIEDEFIESNPRTYSEEIPQVAQELDHNGGLCFIKKAVWTSIGGMRNKYRRSQDLDLTIRLKSVGIKIIRIPYLAAKHHTVDYRNENRMWSNLRQGNNLYSGMILRDHLLNADVLKRILRSEYTALCIFLLVGMLFFSTELFLLGGGIYLIFLFIRIIVQTLKAKTLKSKMLYFFERLLYQFLSDLYFWIGFLFFYPKNAAMNYTENLKTEVNS